MPFAVVLLWAVSVSAQRLTPPRLVARAPIPAFGAAAPAFAAPLSPPLAAPALSPSPAPEAPEAPAAADGLLGKTARALAVIAPEDPAWDREVFEAMFSGRYKGPKPWTDIPDSPQVEVGATRVDRRAPGARAVLKALALGPGAAVIGLVEGGVPRVLSAEVLGRGARGHADLAPPDAASRKLIGYTLRLEADGTVQTAGSGRFPGELSPRSWRAVRRYLGLTLAGETAWRRLRRAALRVWDALLLP